MTSQKAAISWANKELKPLLQAIAPHSSSTIEPTAESTSPSSTVDGQLTSDSTSSSQNTTQLPPVHLEPLSRRKAREADMKCQLAEILSNREFHHHFVINFLSFANT